MSHHSIGNQGSGNSPRHLPRAERRRRARAERKNNGRSPSHRLQQHPRCEPWCGHEALEGDVAFVERLGGITPRYVKECMTQLGVPLESYEPWAAVWGWPNWAENESYRCHCPAKDKIPGLAFEVTPEGYEVRPVSAHDRKVMKAAGIKFVNHLPIVAERDGDAA